MLASDPLSAGIKGRSHHHPVGGYSQRHLEESRAERESSRLNMPGRLNLAMREEGVDRQEWRTTKVGRREREREERAYGSKVLWVGWCFPFHWNS